MPGQIDLEAKLDRLTRLVGTDEGFYVLALHAFIESFLRYERGYGEDPKFPELTWSFREELLREHGGVFIDGLNVLGRLGKQHTFTNKVRHAFENMDPEEAAAATHLFLKFCVLAGLADYPQMGKLKSSLDVWKDRTSIIEQNSVIRQMQRELEELRKEKESFAAQQDAYRQLKTKIRELQHQVSGYTLEIEKRTEAVQRKDSKVDELRQERNRLMQERDRLLGEAEKYSSFERYLRYLGRLSLCTRTRMDYEQTIAELTPEQEGALENIRLKKDFLVRGGAGTGKSLVLLESLRRAAEQNELDFGEGEQIVLVTFTRTLAKYNRYISRLMGLHLPLEVIGTVDKLFYDKLTQIYPEAVYDFDLLENYLAEYKTPPFFTKEELLSEIENFIFGNGISKREYIDEMVPRKGMRKRLGRAQRKEVWAFTETFIRRMEETETYTKNYGRLKLCNWLKENPARKDVRNIGYLFLDEVQDLTPVALMIVKELTSGAVIMAGDAGQSLYNFQSPFERAGIKLRGNTRVLKTNFRNTRQIHEFAEAFRALGPKPDTDLETEPFAFREGPLPEVYVGDTGEAGAVNADGIPAADRPPAGDSGAGIDAGAGGTADTLLTYMTRSLSLYIDDLGYDPENICILVPRNRDIETVASSLSAPGHLKEAPGRLSPTVRLSDPGQVTPPPGRPRTAGYETCTITGRDFDFTDAGRVRISTLHSSKGLDFPVVFLYLPYLHRRHHYGEEEEELMLRNLVYVGITRAMDNVLIFLGDTGDPILQDLKRIS